MMTTENRPKFKAPDRLTNGIGVRGARALIEWPTTEELDRVSAQLRRINEIGISSEANGDYFTSGDLAYQLHEVLRVTRELLKKSLRNEGE